jgi:hypothetical protein
MSSQSPDSILISSDGTELNVVNGSAIPANTRGILLAGTNAGTARFISVDGSGQVITVGAGTAGAPSGGVFSIQGITGGTALTIAQATASSLNATVVQGTANTLANAWPIKLTDGTNTMPTGDVAARAVYHRITDGTNTLGTSANPLITQAGSGGYAGQVEGRAAAGAATVGNPV